MEVEGVLYTVTTKIEVYRVHRQNKQVGVVKLVVKNEPNNVFITGLTTGTYPEYRKVK